MLTIVIAMGVGAIVFGYWMARANDITYKDRTKLLNFVSNSGHFSAYIGVYDKVSYQEHMREIILFRDPWLKYSDQELIYHMKKHNGEI